MPADEMADTAGTAGATGTCPETATACCDFTYVAVTGTADVIGTGEVTLIGDLTYTGDSTVVGGDDT